MPLLSYSGMLNPELCAKHPNAIFLFGDNCCRAGEAGQACIRRCPNAFGIPTKRAPGMDPIDFFVDEDMRDNRAVITAVLMAQAMAKSLDVVVPTDNAGTVTLGLGLSQLPEHAPALYHFIASQLAPTGEFYG